VTRPRTRTAVAPAAAGAGAQVGHGGPAPAIRRLPPVPAPVRVGLLTCLLAVAAAAALLLPRPPGLEELTRIPWWVFAGLFAVAEACVVQLRLRREAFSLSLSEVPLVMGLFLAEPHDLLAGRVVGSAAVFVLYRRQTALKACFNTALVGAGAGAAVSVFALVLAGGDPLGGRGWVAALVAACVAGLLDAGSLLLVVRWFEGRMDPRDALHELWTSVLGPGLVSLVGVVAVLAFSRGEAALPLAVTGAAALLGYRAFATLSDRHSSLERLYELSDALAAAPASADVISSVLTQACDLLRAGYAEVMLSGIGGDGPTRWSVRTGEPIRGPQPAAALAGHGLPFPPLGARLVRAGGPSERAFLEARLITEAVVVPLRVDETVTGHLVLGDRAGDRRGFSEGDVRLLETVANHGSVALRNGRLIDRLNFEARHDELTGLPNRLSFKEALEQAAARAADGEVACSVMVLDFDGFKAINDTLGHQAGDDLLRVLAGRLAEAAEGDALVARMGGDEFAVLSTSHPDEARAQGLALRLLGVFDEPVAVAGTRLRLGGSLGIALGPEHGASGSDLLRNADIAMYAAKSSSGGARLFSADLVETTATALTLASDLRDAVAADEIEVAVQPLVELATGHVHSVEVLARWRHPELGEIPPEAFFVAAERSGQIMTLSSRILDRALLLCRQWHTEGRAVRVAVNLAPRWLADTTLPEQVGAALARHGVPASLLCLEITESSVIADPRRAIGTLSRLRDMGVHLSVDDFGTGYSSLTYLSRLPVHQLKIDKSFVQRLQESGRDRAIVRSIVDLGRNLGLEVVAEGVTDAGVRRALQEMGCGLAQGYLFARPLPPALLPAYLDQHGAPDGNSLVPPSAPLAPRDGTLEELTAMLPLERRRHRPGPTV